MEKQFSIRFSFLNEDVVPFTYTYQVSPKTLDEALQLMRFQSPVEISITGEKNYSITLSDELLCINLKDVNLYPISHVRFQTKDAKFWYANHHGKIYLSTNEGYDIIKITHKTYEELSINKSELIPGDCYNIVLYDVKSLDEITLYEYLTRGLQLSADGKIQLTPSEFSPLPGLIEPDVFHSLQYVPGAVNTQESIADINIRGGTHDQNLVLWNGARMYQTSHFFGMISAINPSIAHRIDVYKNASSAFYTDGVSGVIDITSQAEQNEHQNNRLGAAINLLDAQAFAEQKFNFGRLAFSSRASYNDLWESPSFENYFDKVFQNTRIFESETQTEIPVETRTSFNYYDAAIHFNTTFKEKHHIAFNATGILNQLNFDELNLLNDQQKNNSLEQSSLLSSLSYTNTWNESHQSEIRATLSYYKLDAINQAINSEQILDQQNSVFDTGIDIRHRWIINYTTQLNLGYQFNEIGVRNDNIVNIPQLEQRDKKVLMRHGLIATIDMKFFKEKLKTHLGIRGNYYDRFNLIKVEPSLKLSTEINPFWSMSILGEQKYQAMNQVIDVQQDFLGVEKRRWVLSDHQENPLLQNFQGELQSIYRKNN
ncbi:MAG: Plug domain-containing protein, partial [Flavobacteriaceae bacterium]|nr:Plug domain-containing protein [Flavobacteriaceae bacterium]